MSLKDYINEKPVLHTERLMLRRIMPSDVADLTEWLGDNSLYQYWGKRPGKSDLNPELLFQKKDKPTKNFHWGIIHKADDKVIGELWVYLIENDRMAKVAFRLSPAYQGKGFMTEALFRVVTFCFEETELQRLWSDVHILNYASYKTLEKAGFKREGHIRNGKMVNTYCDYYLYGMVKADYTDIIDKQQLFYSK
jgi:RimJ/RimL family protein N-acetyltransferase